MIDSDLKRSYYQYLQHIKMGHIKPGMFARFLLSMIFVVLFLFSIFFSFLYFRKNPIKRKNYLIDHSNIEPHKSIKDELTKDGTCELIKASKYVLPVLPMRFYEEIFKNPRFYLRRMDFLGALSLRVMQYYSLFYKNKMKSLVVLQEYSFYMSYLTYLVESEGGKLFNIMHGIPGKEASFFRFSKCFVWGEYFKDLYIRQHAKSDQFIVSGSIYHTLLLRSVDMGKSKVYDIVYMMQGGAFVTKDEVSDVLDTLRELSGKYKIAVKQHPLYKIELAPGLRTIDKGDIIEVLPSTRIVISHFSTSLLDAKIVGLQTVAYSKIERGSMLGFMKKEEIMDSKSDLLKYLEDILYNQTKADVLKSYYIDLSKSTLTLLKKEIELIK